MADDFYSLSGSMGNPATGGAAVTPDDDTDLSPYARALYVGTAGDLTVIMLGGQEVTFANVPAGSMLPIRVKRVMEDTTATDIVSIF